jgi:UrcA family protein
MFSKTMIATLAALAALGSAASVHAASTSDPDTVSVKVFIGDLNLDDAAGAAVALQRIEASAGAICGDKPDQRLLGDTARYRACTSATVTRAVASLDNPTMTALNAGRRAPNALVAGR